jgi:acyl carrier protein
MPERPLIAPTLAAVREALARALPRLPQDPAADLFERGVIDSLRLVEAIAALETAFGITFEPEDLRQANFSTLQRIVQTVERILARR